MSTFTYLSTSATKYFMEKPKAQQPPNQAPRVLALLLWAKW
jgi:hypothetical protein